MKKVCVKCGKEQEQDNICMVDGDAICVSCIYGELEPIAIYPIGFVVNNQNRALDKFGLESKDKISKIELLKSQRPFMYKLEEEKNITVIYYLHKTRSVKSTFKRGFDGKKVGVFASRTPDRLSGLAIQNVCLNYIEGTTLHVEGLDAVNGSPILDIKMCWNG
jgi:formylmethanofuran dehydrogenase subunit E